MVRSKQRSAMGIFDLYSKRRKRERGEIPDVYQYTDIPNALRVQVVHIWTSAFGEPQQYTKAHELFQQMHDALCREYGVFDLTERRERSEEHTSELQSL